MDPFQEPDTVFQGHYMSLCLFWWNQEHSDLLKKRRFKDFDWVNLEEQDGYVWVGLNIVFKYSCNCEVHLAQLHIYSVDASA